MKRRAVAEMGDADVERELEIILPTRIMARRRHLVAAPAAMLDGRIAALDSGCEHEFASGRAGLAMRLARRLAAHAWQRHLAFGAITDGTSVDRSDRQSVDRMAEQKPAELRERNRGKNGFPRQWYRSRVEVHQLKLRIDDEQRQHCRNDAERQSLQRWRPAHPRPEEIGIDQGPADSDETMRGQSKRAPAHHLVRGERERSKLLDDVERGQAEELEAAKHHRPRQRSAHSGKRRLAQADDADQAPGPGGASSAVCQPGSVRRHAISPSILSMDWTAGSRTVPGARSSSLHFRLEPR